MAEPAILTIKEVAALLRVAEKTAYTLAQGGDLPGFKVGGQWRFRRRDIEAWIDERTRATADGSDRGGPSRWYASTTTSSHSLREGHGRGRRHDPGHAPRW